MKNWLKQNRFPLLLALGISLMVVVFWCALAKLAGPGSVWLGTPPVNSGDQAYYFSIVNQIKDGAWSMQNLYAPLPQAPFWHPTYVVVGILARMLRLNVILAMEISTIIAFFASILLLHSVSRRVAQNEDNAKLATALIAFCGGLGWLGIIVFSLIPGFENLLIPDMGTEAFLFPTWLMAPHIALSVCLLPFVLLSAWEAANDTKIQRSSWSGWLTTLVLALIHPYALLTVGIFFWMVFAYQRIKTRKPSVLIWIPFILAILIGIAPHLWGVLSNAGQQRLLMKNDLPITPISLWIFTFLPWIALAVTRLRKHRLEKHEIWIAFWLIASFIAILLPFHWDRKLTEGWNAALIWLGLPVIIALNNRWRETRISFMIPMFLLALSSVYIYVEQLPWGYRGEFNRSKMYASKDEAQAWTWVHDNTPKEARVLTDSIYEGTWVAAFSARPVYIGNVLETPNIEEKFKSTNRFFANMSTSEQITFLEKENISIIITTSVEKRDLLSRNLINTPWHIATTLGNVTVYTR